VALYGKRWESVAVVFVVLGALLAVSIASTGMAGAPEWRLFLFGSIAIMLSIAIQTLRNHLEESNEHTRRLLQQEETINWAAKELVLLSEPPAIMELGARLAARIASPSGGEIRRASYFRVEDGMAVIGAQCDSSGLQIDARWPLAEHPGLRDAVVTLRPVAGAIEASAAGPIVRRMVAESGITHGAWVPVCPDGTLHGVLGIASQGEPVPPECLDRCVALGHFLELALSNWAAHQELARQATAEERRRIARELHDGLAHELALIASKTRGARRGAPSTLDAQELAGAADRALDEARRAITVLSVARPQSLVDAIAQTAEDLGARLGMTVDLDLAEDVEVPGEVTENLLRIVREAMTNAARHGGSEHVRVILERGDRLRLVIEDDGSGFDPYGRRKGESFGLLGMEERAASLGADLIVDSAPDEGTRVAVAFR
jgi:signal transduction histidine kinase